MGERIKIFVIIAVLGFIAGIVADLTAEYVLPLLIEILPAFLHVRFVLSGIAGTCLTLLLVSIWAHFTGSSEK